jgi:hypothetical protein
MGLKATFTEADVRRALDLGALEIERGILRIFQFVGEKFVKDAKESLKIDAGMFPKGDYQDQTANLRSSIGFMVLKDGIVQSQKVERSQSEGVAAAMSLLYRIPKEGYQLIGVAGMDYASAVESRGYNVITSQADFAIVDLSSKLKEYQRRMNQKGVGVKYDDISNLVTTMMR